MAKLTVYLRVGKRDGRQPYMIEANLKPSSVPLIQRGAYNKPDVYLPTVSFGIDFNLPDELFEQASNIIGEINIAAKDAMIAATVDVPALSKGKG
jgi:hypothetical protein